MSSQSSLFKIFLTLAIVLACQSSAWADTSSVDRKSFDKLYSDWTESFNKKDLVGTMKIFAPTCVASLPDATHKTYDQIDQGFRKLFADKEKSYQYTYDVHNIYQNGDLAAVRITWHLTVNEKGKVVDKTNEHGLDVLQRDTHGAWQIVNWVAFSEKYQR
jgi:uncharacterized protein (TIGR02246 family)